MPEEDLPDKPDPRVLARFRLGVREYSARELERYLRRKGVEAGEAERVVAELGEKGLLSDARYSRVIAREQVRRDKGPMAIAQKLGAKGVRVDLRAARELYHEANDGQDERSAILSILERRYPRAAAGGGDERERRRAFQGLLRRGFSRALVAEILFSRGGDV